jgi:hypothetical protein
MTYDAEMGSLAHIVHRAYRYQFNFMDYVSRHPKNPNILKFYTMYSLPQDDVINWTKNMDFLLSEKLINKLNGMAK